MEAPFRTPNDGLSYYAELGDLLCDYKPVLILFDKIGGHRGDPGSSFRTVPGDRWGSLVKDKFATREATISPDMLSVI